MTEKEDIDYFSSRIIDLHRDIENRDEVIHSLYNMIDEISRYGIKLDRVKEYRKICRKYAVKIRNIYEH